MVSLRQRNRFNAMRSTQRAALPLFMKRGFDAVTVGEIADEVGMAASTIYRHFTNKEAIVIWDEHDVAIDAALEAALKSSPPLEALRTVFIEELGGRYDADLTFQLQRVRYIYATEQLHAAAVEADLGARAELTKALESTMSKEHRDAAAVLAGASLVALDVAIDRWQAGKAKSPLASYIADGFVQLGQLDQLA